MNDFMHSHFSLGYWLWTQCMSVLLGLLCGSFVSVLVVRLPQQKSVITPRSHCPHCSRTLRWVDNIPLVSYLLLKGQCRFCQHAISGRYPLIEFLTAALFLMVHFKKGWSSALFYREWPWIIMLVSIVFIDIEHRIIPNILSLGGLILGLLTSCAPSAPGFLNSVMGAGIGFLLFYLLAWFYERIRKQSGLGGGDIKLLAMIGAFLGPQGVLTTIVLSSVFGSLVGIGWAFLSQEKQILKFAIPFGPFLVFGALCNDLLGNFLCLPSMILM